MEKEIKINPKNVFTKTEYHKKFGVNRMKIDKWIREKQLNVININGATLIIVG